MPDGSSHAAASILIAGVPWPIWMANNIRPILPAITLEAAMGISFGCLAGILISPDLDLEDLTLSKSIMYRSNGLVGVIWAALWWPYSQLVKHRSILSHGPIIGTLLRLAYLVGTTLLVWTLLAGLFNWPQPNVHTMIWWIEYPGRWCVIGLALSDAAHWAMDNLF